MPPTPEIKGHVSSRNARNTRGFIFAVAPMAQFRRFHGGKKRWKTHPMLDKVCCCHPPFLERGGSSAPIRSGIRCRSNRAQNQSTVRENAPIAG